MPPENLFDLNCERFSHIQPKIALMLPYHDLEQVQWALTERGEPNLVDSHSEYLHDPSGAIQEMRAWRAGLELGQCDVVYIYGIGLGYAYDVLFSWLEASDTHHLIFLEDDRSILARFFETERASKILQDPQVSVRFSESLLEDKTLFDWLCWDFLQRKVAVSALPSYRKRHRHLFDELKQKILFDHHRTDEAIDEYLDYGVSYYRNYYSNLYTLPNSYDGSGLYGKFRGIPAVICGAGPSLAHALPHLQNLRDKALIFAGGSARNALNHAGLQPHFGVGVDPNAAQVERLSGIDASEVPFFYRPRMHREALQLVQGPLLYVPGGGGYQTAAAFESAVGISCDIPQVDEGHNVVNLSAALAIELGCDPIIFVGLDLAYTDMQLYAPGVIGDSRVTTEDIFNDQRVDRAAVQRADIHGQPIYTLWKWIAEADWLHQFAKKHQDRTFINATGGGLGILEVPDRDLSKLVDTLSVQQNLSGVIAEYVAQAVLPVDSTQRIDACRKQLITSLESCVEHFTTILNQLQSLAREIEKHPEEELDLHTGMLALVEVELEAEPAFKYVLNLFNEIYLHLLNREFKELAQQRLSILERNRRHLALAVRRQSFLREAARANLLLLQEAEQWHTGLNASK